MDGMVPNGMDMADLPKQFLRDRSPWDVVGNGDTLGGLSFVDGRFELEKSRVFGNKLSERF